MKKEYKVTDQTGVHEYTIVLRKKHKKTTYQICRSHSDFWTPGIRGKVIYTFVSDGNGFRITKIPKNLEYNRAMELHMLLTFIQHHRPLEKGSTIELPKNKKIKL